MKTLMQEEETAATACKASGKQLKMQLFGLFAALTLSACSGIVIDPTDKSVAFGPTKFWGYAVMPDDEMRLEAQNTSNTWELITSTRSATTPTHSDSRTGYYWELTTNPRLIAVRFKRSSPYSGYSRILYRVKSPSLNPAETRTENPMNPPPPSATSNLERLWAMHKSDGLIRIDIQN